LIGPKPILEKINESSGDYDSITDKIIIDVVHELLSILVIPSDSLAR
jgi:hypothetical protein